MTKTNSRCITVIAACGLSAGLLTLDVDEAAAQGVDYSTASTEVVGQLADDITLATLNTPVWLAQHLPAMMAQSGMGAGIDVSKKAGGFSFGLIPVRVGLLNQFNTVGEGTQVLSLEDALPGNLPWLQFGVVAGVGLGSGFELGMDFQFFPDTDMALSDGITVDVGVLSFAGTLRWRINNAKGALPAFVIGVGGGYYAGHLDLGTNFKSSYTFNTSVGPAEGTYTFVGAPHMSWSLWQISPEVRLGWKIGPIRPYLGFGFGITGGSVSGGTQLKAIATIESVGGQAVPGGGQPVVYEERDELIEAAPAQFVFRPHLGLDIVAGIVAITLQADLAVMTNQSLSGGDLSGAASSFEPQDGDFLYSDASKESQTAAALVLTSAIRFQF